MKRNVIIISCGGTGGHIFPALEIARSLQKINPNYKLLFVGAIGRMEMQKVPQSGFQIIGIWIQAFYRNSILKNLLFPFKLLISLIHSCLILFYYRPVAVIGTGGFVTGPILFVASILKFKTYIQEQNCFPGLTNRLLGKKVKKIFVAHEHMECFFPKEKIINTGNPVRGSLKTSNDLKFIRQSRSFFGLSKNKLTILVIGGSLGAQPINKKIQNNLNKFIENDCQLIWQTGSLDYQKFKNLNSKFCFVSRFIDRMDLAYSAADVVISRAGAIAIAEISFLRKSSILIPSPYVTDDHQTKNAKYLHDNNACMFFNEAEFINVDLIKIIEKLKSHSYRNNIGENAWKLFKYDASANISKIIVDEINNEKC